LRPKFRTNYSEISGNNQIGLNVALPISIFLFIVFTLGLINFIRKLKHHLISYRPTYLSISTGICTAIYCITLPVSIYKIF